MKFWKRFISCFLTVLLFVSMFNGCLADEKKTIKVWGGALVNQATNDAFEARIKSFAEAHNCNVDFEWIEEVYYRTKFAAALEAGDLADVAYCTENVAFQYYPNIPFMDLHEVKDMIETKTGRKFMPGLLRDIEGGMYNLPFGANGGMVFFRKSAFEKIEINEENFPRTWDGIADACLKLQATDPGMYTFGVGCGATDNDSEVNLREWMWAKDGGLFDKDGNPNTNQEGSIHVWTRYKELWDAGCIPESALTWGPTGNNTSYLTGEAALIINNVSFYNALTGEGNEKLLEDTGFAQVPEGPSLGIPLGYGIMKDTKVPDLAAELLAYLYEPEWYDNFIISCIPTMGPVFNEVIENNPDVFKGVNMAVDLRGVEKTPFGYPAGLTVKGLKNAAIVFGAFAFNKNLQTILVDGIPVEDALANLQKDMEALIE